MDRDVYLIANGEEYYLGEVGEIFDVENTQGYIQNAMRDIVDNLVFSDDSGDYMVCSIEVR